MTELQLFDAPGADVAEIVTDGSVFKPFLTVIEHVADEARIRVTEHGLECEVVDSANVFMVDTFLAADAFETFDVSQEAILGVPIDELQKLIRRARKGYDDALTLSIQERELTATVERGYENHDVVSQGTLKLIDPDAMRDAADVPDLEYDVDVTVDTEPLVDALSYAQGASEYVEMALKGVNQHTNALYIGGETDTRAESAAIDNIDSDSTARSIYSGDYMAEILGGIESADASDVRLRFDEEFPAVVSMERDGVPMRVDYFLAPRVTDD